MATPGAVSRRRWIVPWTGPRRVLRGVTGSSVVWQVDDQDIHRSARQQRPGHRDPFVRRFRLQDDEPFQPDPAGNRLDRIETPGKVYPGGNRATGLGLGNQPQGQGRLAARGLPA